MIPLANFTRAVEELKKRKRMTLQEFASCMGYQKYSRHYMVSIVIPRALALVADEETRKCFRLVRDMVKKEYYVEWVC